MSARQAWTTPKMMEGLRQVEQELIRLREGDRDIRAQQATTKLLMQLQRLVEVLLYGEPKTKMEPRHHE